MRGLHQTLLVAFAILSIPGVGTVAAQGGSSESRFTVEKSLDLESVSNPVISPDGSQIVYTRERVDKVRDRRESDLWIMNSDGSRNRFLTPGSNAVWSPDGTRVAYTAPGDPEGAQVWVKYIDAEGATQVTSVSEAPGNLRWSPDGRSVGFSMFVPQRDSWDIDMPRAPEGAEWTKAPAVIDRLHYRQDRRGYTESGNVHLFRVPADGGTERTITSGDWSVGARFDQLAGGVGWDWMPGGRTVIVEGLQVENPDSIYRDAYLYSVDVETGRVVQLTPERGTWTSPLVSPDGRWIAYLGNPYSRMSYRAAELYVMAPDGSGVRNLTDGLDRDPSNVRWAPDGRGLYFTVQNEGTQNVYFAPLRGDVRQVTTGNHLITLGSISRDGVIAAVRASPHQPPDVVRFPAARPSDVRQLTRVNEDLLSGMQLGEVEEIWFNSTDGTRVQGWLVKPPSFDPSRRYPLILEIHGGPHSMYSVAFNPMFQNFAANEFVVLYTNPRGSTGYGTEFGNAIERAYPSVDYDDLMAGVDAAIAKGYVDPENMFVGGCSGGGVLSSWVIGKTDRFKAAAVRCPVINWLSFVGQTDVPWFTQNFFEQPFWVDPEPWLRQSPLMYVGNVNTPTLLMTGVLDLRTPMPQTEEYYAALKMRGVPSRLLRFEGEYHGTGSRPSNWMRSQLYMMDWYRRWGTFDDDAQR